MTATPLPNADWRFCVAPMMDWTTPACRYFHRQLSRHARLYTEMVTANAIIHGDREHLLGFDRAEHPVALQLGGSEPQALAQAARIGAEFGYDEINLNCGCPSDRVQNGAFGACLMAQPERVAEGVAAMRAAVDVPVTVKCRLGIDDLDSDEHLHRFIGASYEAGCRVFIVHARKAWLQGLSPKQNRDIPPLQYERVFRLKQAFSDCTIVLNGGLESLTDCEAVLDRVDGVMLGRAAYKDPYLLAEVDRKFYDAQAPVVDRNRVVEAMLDYVERECARGVPVHRIVRHMLGLFNGQRNAKLWRRALSAVPTTDGVTHLRKALDLTSSKTSPDLSNAA